MCSYHRCNADCANNKLCAAFYIIHESETLLNTLHFALEMPNLLLYNSTD